MPKAVLLVLACLVAVGVAFAAVARTQEPSRALSLAAEPPAPTASATATLLVDVVGAVARPGVVQLPAGARVLDALLAAGGMTGDADLFALNKAAPLRDGDRVYVPRPGEPPSIAAREDLVDLNRATPAQLEALPGVGPGTAARIVRARAQRRFMRVEELQTRGLVSARVFSDVRDLVVVR